MPPCTEYEPHNIFNEDLLQSTSFIDLLQKSSDVNMSCYMSDEEPLALPPMLSSTSELSPIGDSVNLLEIINQDLMLGSNLQSASSIAPTEVTYVTQSTAPSASPFIPVADMFLPGTTAKYTFRKPVQTPSSTNQFSRTISNLTLSPSRSLNSPATSQSTNPFLVNPFVSYEKQFARNPVASTSRIENENVCKTDKASFISTKKSKCKSRGCHKDSNHSKSSKKTSGSSNTRSIFDAGSSQKSHVPASTRSDLRSSLTHTVTRTINIATERSAVLTTDNVLNTTTLAPTDSCTITANATETTSALGVITTLEISSIPTTYTMTKGVTSIISPMRNTYLSKNVLYSTPIISRTPSAATSPTVGRVEQFAILPVDSNASQADGLSRLRARLVMPVSLNAYTTSAANVDTTTASFASKHRIVHTVRPFLPANSASYAPTTTSSIFHNTYALRPGTTLYAARKFMKPEGAVTTEPRTFAIVDEKGTYTLTISSGFTSTTGGSILMTQTQNTISITTGVTNTSTVASDTIIRHRNQLIFPLPNSQMNTSTSLGYLVNSPMGSDVTPLSTTAVLSTHNTTTTTIASHTITTISSEALNRIRSRLIYNVPSTSAGQAADGNRPRGQVTIIANQLISPGIPRPIAGAPSAVCAVPSGPRAVFSAASQGLFALTTPISSTVSSTSPVESRPVNRVVIPINVHTTSTLSSHTVTSPGAYIIAGVGSSPSNTGDAVTRPSRVVIPIITNTSAATTTSRPCPAAASDSTCNTPSDMYSRLRSRLTIQVTTAESSMPETTTPITTYTVSKTHTPQSIYTVPTGGSTPYTKNSEALRNPATMTLITFASPSTVGGVPHRCPAATRANTPSPTPTLSTTGNRFVIKLSTGQNAATSVTTPITSTAINPAHQFAELHPQISRLRTFPGPRTSHSVAQRNTIPAPQRPITRNFNPHASKIISAPAPLQIFADVVCPPKTTTTATQGSKFRFTLSQSPVRTTLVVPQYKNSLSKNSLSVANSDLERIGSRNMGSSSSERFVSNRSVALVSPRREAVSSSHRSRVDATETSVRNSSSSDESSRSSSPDTNDTANQDCQNDSM